MTAWTEERKAAWAAFAAFQGNMVPTYQSGNAGANSNAMNWMEMMGMKAAKDLNLDLSKGSK